MESNVLTILAFGVNCALVCATIIGLRRSNQKDLVDLLTVRVEELERQISELKADIKECEEARQLLSRQNLDLLRNQDKASK